VPDDVDARMLDPEVRRELRSLTRESADLVARHLVMTGRLLDEDPERALAHARAARAMAGRVGAVRETAGLAAYAAGEWNEALAELRAARRITGRPEHLAVLADCERGLGRPERALAYGDDPAVPSLAQDERVELVIVLAGARRDLGQQDAAVLTLQDPARRTTPARPWAARLWYAYADTLLAAGRAEEARSWFEKVVSVDPDGQTDAGDRLLELDGVVLQDFDEDESDDSGMAEADLASLVAEAFPPPSPVSPGAEPASSAPTDAVDGPADDAARSSDAADDSAPAASPARGASLMPLFASPPKLLGPRDEEPPR
jgi:tetratricopeptide (TPR) repeat protein